MPRSIKKGPFIDGHLSSKITKTITTNGEGRAVQIGAKFYF